MATGRPGFEKGQRGYGWFFQCKNHHSLVDLVGRLAVSMGGYGVGEVGTGTSE